ncbi:MAG: hypothetical protein U0791_09445 [Gemmataceae bacterium]
MPRFALGLPALLLAAGLTAAQEKPADILQKAIKAHGGEANLKKLPAGLSKIAGTVVEPKLPFTGSMAFSVPDKVRVEMVFEIGGQKASTVQIINGDKVSQTENGVKAKLTVAAENELRESAAIQELSQLFPLLGDKYVMAAGKDGTFDGKECVTLVVKAKGLKETTLAFDKKTGLLTAMQRKGVNPSQKVVDELTVFSEFKTVEGLVVPTKSKVSHDGRPFLELTVVEYKPLPKVDDKLFVVE